MLYSNAGYFTKASGLDGRNTECRSAAHIVSPHGCGFTAKRWSSSFYMSGPELIQTMCRSCMHMRGSFCQDRKRQRVPRNCVH
jgi:hypothetical protein